MIAQKEKFTAIIYCSEPQPVTGLQFLKYRNITDKGKFLLFAAKFPAAQYVNFYHKQTRLFNERIYLQ